MPKLLPSLAVALTNLQRSLGWDQGELAAALGKPPNLLSAYARGRKRLTLEKAVELAAPMQVSRETIQEEAAHVERLRERAGKPVYPAAPGGSDAERGRIDAVVRAVADATAQVMRPFVANLSMQIQAMADRQLALGAWKRLMPLSPAERRSRIRKFQEYRDWAVCEAACEESRKAAPDSAARALEYAELAVEIARLAPGEDLFRRRLQGYAEAHI